MKSDIWEIEILDTKDQSLSLMNRKYKFFPNEYLKQYTFSLYIDANIRLFCSPVSLINRYLSHNLMAMPNHLRRDCIYSEAIQCIKIGKVDEKLAKKQMLYYKNKNYPKNNGLAEMNIILRKHNEKDVVNVMNDWWNEINTFTQRDQLSFSYVSWKNNLTFSLMNENSRSFNKYFFAECHKNDSPYNKVKIFLKKIYFNIKIKLLSFKK